MLFVENKDFREAKLSPCVRRVCFALFAKTVEDTLSESEDNRETKLYRTLFYYCISSQPNFFWLWKHGN